MTIQNIINTYSPDWVFMEDPDTTYFIFLHKIEYSDEKTELIEIKDIEYFRDLAFDIGLNFDNQETHVYLLKQRNNNE